MAKDVTIYQKSTSYHYSSVDRIQTKGLDEDSYVKWLPEDECITGYRKITKNGKYLASADGIAGYTAVFVNVHALAVSGTDPDGEVYRVQVDSNGYLIKTILSTGESVPINSNYIAIPAQEYQGSTITDYSNSTVNVISESAFASCVNLSRVNFPNVHTVKKDAFSGCTILSNISFPKLETIGEGAFAGCVSLVSASFPACTYIGSKAFQSCSNLETIDLLGKSVCILANKDAFSNTTVKVMVPDTLYSYYTVARAWSECADRIKIYGAVEIEPYQYMADESLTIFSNPNVTLIGSSAFYGCTNLSLVYLPKAIDVGKNAFRACRNLASINLHSCVAIGEEAFAFANIKNISIPAVQTISDYAFVWGCSEKWSFSINAPSLRRIGSGVFEACGITALSAPNLSEAGDLAFFQCKLKSLSLPALKKVGSRPFEFCEDLITVDLPQLSEMYTGFLNCHALRNVNLPNILILRHIAFGNCYALSTISLPKLQMMIGEPFYSCSNLKSVYLMSTEIVNADGWVTSPTPQTKFYVPKALVGRYKAESNWELVKSQIVGI